MSSLDLHRGVAQVALSGVVVLAVHVGAMILSCGVVALVMYEVVGLSVLRRLWFNLDRVWAFALVGAGAATLLTA